MNANYTSRKRSVHFWIYVSMIIALSVMTCNKSVAYASNMLDMSPVISAEATAGKELIEATEGRILFYEKDTGLYGFLDEEGQVVVPPVYDHADVYSDGLAWVDMRGDVSFLDMNGDQVFTAAEVLGEAVNDPYAAVYSFKDGLARVNTSESTGYIDQQGEYVIPLGTYYDGYDFSGGVAQVFDEEYKGLFIDTSGDVLFSADPAFSYYEFVNDRALVYSYETEQYGYVDTFGAVLIKPQLDDGYSYTGPFAVYEEGGSKGIIDRNGFFVLWPGFEEIVTQPSGMIGVYDGVITTFLNEKAEPVYAIPTDQTATMYDTFFVRYERGKYVFRDYAGNELLKLDDYWSLGDGLIESGDGAVYVFRDVSTDIPVQTTLSIDNSYTYSFVDDQGKEVLELSQYDHVEPFYEGRAKVERNGLFGYIDTAGSLVIPIQYTRAGNFYDGLAEVADANGGRTIDLSGEDVEEASGKTAGYYTFMKEEDRLVGLIHESSRQIVLAPAYEQITDYGQGVFVLTNGQGLYGWYSTIDDTVVEPQYHDVIVYPEHERVWTVDDKRHYVLRNTMGQALTDQTYEAVYDMTNTLFEVTRVGKAGVVDVDGNVVVEPLYERVTYHAAFPDWCAFSLTGFGEDMLYVYRADTQSLSAPLPGKVEGYNKNLLLVYEKETEDHVVINVLGEEVYRTTDAYRVIDGKYVLFETESGSEYLVKNDGERYLYQRNIQDLWLPVYEEHVLMSDQNGFGVVSLSGTFAGERRYEDVGPIQDGVFAYYDDGKFGYGTVNGDQIIDEDQYVFVHSFSNGLGLVVEQVSK